MTFLVKYKGIAFLFCQSPTEIPLYTSEQVEPLSDS